MCGIFGVINFDGKSVSPDIISGMQSALSHRGPDNSGIYTGSGLALGTNRLAIVDLATGNQPISNEKHDLVIVYNGEIYNHRDIREDLIRRGHTFYTNSDTETVLHAFEEFGEACLTKLNGMFALAIWDIRQRRLFVARDRLGIKPLYITQTGDGFAFASEAKALLNVFTSPMPDWTAISRYFSFGYVSSPQSPFFGIVKLPAGHFGILSERDWSVNSYWKPDYGASCRDSLNVACARVEELMEHAVELELMSDVPVGIFLSGGLDSSAVAVFAARHSRQKIKSFALKFEEETHDESADARIVANLLNLDHTEVSCSQEILRQSLFDVVSVLDEPFGDSTVLPLLVLSRAARRQVKVVLTGWGGDEIFAGYPTYRAHQLASYYRQLPGLLSTDCIPALVNSLPVSDTYMSFEFRAKKFVKGMNLSPELQHFLWMGYYDDAAKARLFRSAILDQIRESAYAEVERLAATLTEQDAVSRIMHLDASFFLEGNGLFQADRMTMAASLEARVPLLNIGLMDYVNSLPLSLKMCGNTPKGLMKKVLEKYLPQRIINKPKKGFGPPSAAWVRGVFSDVFDDLFSRERVESQGIFNHAEIVRLLTEHRKRRADHGRNLWALLSFQLWYDNFIMAKR
jgi:asparagine synthase (glutamine-hydrolysing)